MAEQEHGGQHHAGITVETHHTGHDLGGKNLLPISIIIASIILAGAIVYSAQASLTLAGKVAALQAVPTAVPTAVATAIAATATPSPGATQSPSLAGAPVRGSGSVVMVEYSDFQCPYCGRAEPTLEQIVNQDYKGKVKLVYKHFPLSFHENAERSAEAFECAREQGDDKAWQLHDIMYADQSKLSEADLIASAKTISGMDSAKFETCLKGGSTASKVEANYNEGLAVGVQGTPAFFLSKLDSSGNPVGGWQSVEGAQPFANFKTVIDGLLS